ncbi:MAG: cupin domain-containing protein [Rhodobacteraceae bacterium]|nr:cupin domain-containing protein [Alphaproteobacteria bacterium]MBT8474421.1 cupin domain-containing protein [Alphaproteobacteria bacterium]NNK67086.1 cupin domain-containing protein [Paracoccaceae bacterium]
MDFAETSVVNPMTGTRIELLDLNAVGGRLRYESPPGAGVEYAKHVHLHWEETFDMISGQGEYQLGRDRKVLGEGETVVLPAGVPHVHPTNHGSEPMVMEQTIVAKGGSEASIRATFGVLFSLFDWHGQGKLRRNRMGYPMNPLHFAAMGKVLGDAGSFDGMVPIAAQRFTGATLGRLAMALGYDPIDPKWK